MNHCRLQRDVRFLRVVVFLIYRYGGSIHECLLIESSRPYMAAYNLSVYVLLLSISFNLMSLMRENIMLKRFL
jgi:hypothetical protein